MAKPTVRIPQWANAGSKTDPGTSKEDTGWLVNDRPPANWLNFIWGAIGEWLDFVATPEGYLIDAMAYTGDQHDSNITSPRSMAFADDGLRVYYLEIGVASASRIARYNCARPYRLNDITFDGTTTGFDDNMEDIFMKEDGTRLYLFNNAADIIEQYNLSPAYDFSSITPDSPDETLSTSTEDSSPLNFTISSDGTKLYMFGQTNNTIYRYTMSTAWDLSTATVDVGQTLSVASEDSEVRGIAVSDDGRRLFINGTTATESIYQYDMDLTPFSLASAFYRGLSVDISGIGTDTRFIKFSPNGRYLFLGPATTTSDWTVRRFVTCIAGTKE